MMRRREARVVVAAAGAPHNAAGVGGAKGITRIPRTYPQRGEKQPSLQVYQALPRRVLHHYPRKRPPQ